MKDLCGCILIFIVMVCLGYLVIEWHHDDATKFDKLCSERPALKECPEPERMKTL